MTAHQQPGALFTPRLLSLLVISHDKKAYIASWENNFRPEAESAPDDPGASYPQKARALSKVIA